MKVMVLRGAAGGWRRLSGCGVLALLLALGAMVPGTGLADGQRALVSTYSAAGTVPVRTWKSMRDARVVKQDLDYSCSAASLATVLNEYYGQSLTEKEILDAMDLEEPIASFYDMAQVLPQFGFRGVGYAVSFEQLTRLRIPVVVYLEFREANHFSVVRGIDERTVRLADSSLGNRTFSRSQFLDMWETRDDARLTGKILAVLPRDGSHSSRSDFFLNRVRRQTANAVWLQTLRSAR